MPRRQVRGTVMRRWTMMTESGEPGRRRGERSLMEVNLALPTRGSQVMIKGGGGLLYTVVQCCTLHICTACATK